MPVINIPTQRTAIVTAVRTWSLSWWRWAVNITKAPGVQLSYSGQGDPNGSIVAPVGAFYCNLSGGAGVSFYVKEADPGASTGWVAK